MSTIRAVTLNTLLCVISVLICLTLAEFSLRAFYPKYRYAAESEFEPSKYRIKVRKRNTEYQREHPDTGKSHIVRHNNMALRHMRNIYPQELETSTNIGIFGDSFTENLRLPAAFSFTELLDYLLNRAKPGFNVLNFGVDGYGTDQSYLYYREFEHKQKLDFVFYVFCANDLQDIYKNNLFSTQDGLTLIQNKRSYSPAWVRAISRLHLTYLIIDSLQRVPEARSKQDIENFFKKRKGRKKLEKHQTDFINKALIDGDETQEYLSSKQTFQLIIEEWQTEVEINGGKFFVVLLPRELEHKAAKIIPSSVKIIDLYSIFTSTVPEYQYRDYRFANDGHWNENGNRLAAKALYWLIAQITAEQKLEQLNISDAVRDYYSSIDGWQPTLITPSDVDPTEAKRVVEKYSGTL